MSLNSSVNSFLMQSKLRKSSPFYKNTKVLSCEKILFQNGKSTAIPFKHSKSFVNDSIDSPYKRSSELKSVYGLIKKK